MLKRLKVFIAVLTLLTSVQGAERLQIKPGSYEEINLRYAYLTQMKYAFDPLRPWSSEAGFTGPNLLIQLEPQLFQAGNTVTVGLSSWIQVHLQPGLYIVNEMSLRSASENESTYIGKEWRRVSGGTHQSFLRWQTQSSTKNKIALQVGRFYQQIGPGRSGALLMGAAARPLDQAAFSIRRAITPNLSARFFYQTAVLDKIAGKSRFLSMHRLELKTNRWYFALSEALLYSRENQGLDAVYLNPFIFYHMEQLNGPDLAGNTMGSIEFGYQWKSNHIYSEILIDDVQLDNASIGDLEPNEVGILAGYERAATKLYLAAEYVAITNRTYKTADPTEWFIHRNIPLGYELGSDLARLNLLGRYYFRKNWHLDTELDMVWQGEGDMGKAWDTPWDDPAVTLETGYSESFPTGVVQQSSRLAANVLRHWSTERWISLGCYFENLDNVNHVEGVSDSNFGLTLSASWTLEYSADF